MPERAHAGAGIRGNANPLADADRRARPCAYANGAAYAYCKGIADANARAYSDRRGCANVPACANANCDCDCDA